MATPFSSVEEANERLGPAAPHASGSWSGGGTGVGVGGKMKQTFWGATKQVGKGIGKAILNQGGKWAGSILRASNPIVGAAVDWGAKKALKLVDGMDKGVVRTGLKSVLKGWTNQPGPVPGSHREDRPVQGTAGSHTTTTRKKITDYYGTAPSNGTRNANAVLNNSISGGYGEKESASKNPRHIGPMMSNQYVADRSARVIIKKKRKKKSKKHVAW